MEQYFPTAVLCGSMRFINDFQRAAVKYTLEGYMVFAPFVNDKTEKLNTDQLVQLREMHKRKIEESDLVVIVDHGYYSGYYTNLEIQYAQSLGKQITFWDGNGD